MTEVYNNLYVADISACKSIGDYAVIHACKFPCYNSISNNKNNVLEIGDNLYLNIIDPKEPLFTFDLFEKSIEFIDKHIKDRKVIVHCNQGKSRSASIALLYLFRDKEYWEAQYEFSQIYPNYLPSEGINEYFETNWEILKNIK